MSRTKKLSKPEFGAKAVQFLGIAYKDYLGARSLLNAGLLLQGAVLASTAIEKYFKAILAFRGNESPGHLSKRHINAAKNYDKRLAAALNDSFLVLLQRAYRLRYLDDLPQEFNLVIANREFIAELDFTALTIQESFRMQLNGKDAQFSYHTDKENGDPILHINNYILSGQNKQTFVSAEPQGVYEVRNCKIRGLLEVSYVCTARMSDGQFLREGFKPNGPDCTQYQVSLPPIYNPEHAA
jgi:hypothetical protein